ncbi:hypothetical protein ABT352_33485 [Streptosporangium sp. NPDC000563]|uniref:hypothetical protein n=1 Tax=Streptosporangium sp. NPDC000563 TaxID=3154366 RepID=UPI003324DDAB
MYDGREMEERVGVVTVEDVAVRLKMSRTLTPDQRTAMQDAIDDAIGAVAAHLHVSPVPEQFTERGVRPVGDAWPLTHDPLIEVVSATPETDPVSGDPTGAYTIVYRAGLDPDADPVYRRALRSYVLAHASAMPHIVELAPRGRRVKSSSLEGQSVTYDSDPQAGSGVAGAPPSLTSLDYWRRINTSQAAGIAPHPLDVTNMRWW